MIPVTEGMQELDEEKKRSIIAWYLHEKFEDDFDPSWLDNIHDYEFLAQAIDFFYTLNIDNLNMIAIGSNDETTRTLHTEQFQTLVNLLDTLVKFTDDSPPVAIDFNKKEAVLAGLKLNQQIASCSLRDLHAQSGNLGVAEKLLNGELGQAEWLGEVDLERLLIKFGVKDRVHITRLTVEDLGMILHFERIKHKDETTPYTIPLLINQGSMGSLRSQGSHWTYALVTVTPTTNTVTCNYHDSMPLTGNEQSILTAAINYTDGEYHAFPHATTKTVVPSSDNLQKDGWSCGYRALRGLLADVNFPKHFDEAHIPPNWDLLLRTTLESGSLRDTFYQLLLNELEIEPAYFEAMQCDDELIEELAPGEKYKLNQGFVEQYLDLLFTDYKQTKSVLVTDHFKKDECGLIFEQVSQVDETLLGDSTQFKQNIDLVLEDKSLSSNAKIIALLNIYAAQFAENANKFFGANPRLERYLAEFCVKSFGVVLKKDGPYHIKKDGLIMRILEAQVAAKPRAGNTESLLPPAQKMTPVVTEVSRSTPVVGADRRVGEMTVSKSVNQVSAIDLDAPRLRTHKDLVRLGSMFGVKQFCYANKPGGVEPGFRAIDLDAVFFEELEQILKKENLPAISSFKSKLVGLRTQLSSGNLEAKRIIFSTFINANVSDLRAENTIDPAVLWLCNAIKEAVAKNDKLSAWMYKLDYAEAQENRVKVNKEAIREFVGTHLAKIFSDQNQRQEIIWVNSRKKGVHALLACGWKNGLKELSEFLHGGQEPDYTGILVEDKTALIKRSKHIPGLGKNLIFGIALGDRDGMGKNAQNKGFADGDFYGFDYGKPYESAGVCPSLKDDFSFEDSAAKMPAILRSSRTIGWARHYMYRNYSVFYDTTLVSRMVGVHLLKKMITGENPSEEVMKSYPGLRGELYRIEERTPSVGDLLGKLAIIIKLCPEKGKLINLLDCYVMQVSSGKMTPFECYFAEIKINLINEAVINNMPFEELKEYLIFIDEMAVVAAENNAKILEVFQQRVLLTSDEIDFLDKLEKIFSPTDVMSHDGQVFLNTMRFDPPDKRVPFALIRQENGDYTLSTTNSEVAAKFKELFQIDLITGTEVSSCTVIQEEMQQFMHAVDKQYHKKREAQLLRPTCDNQTIPMIVELMNHEVKEAWKQKKVNIDSRWHADGSLSLHIIAKTPDQIRKIKEIFGVTVKINEAQIIDVAKEELKGFQQDVVRVYKETQAVKLRCFYNFSVITDKWKHFSENSKTDDVPDEDATELDSTAPDATEQDSKESDTTESDSINDVSSPPEP